MATSWRTWLAASIAVHVAAIALGARVRPASRTVPASAPGTTVVAVDVVAPPPVRAPATHDVSASIAHVEVERAPDAPGSPPVPQNVDAITRGERGDARSREAGRRLADRADGVNYSADLANARALDQVHRLATAHERASPQEVRSTPHEGDDAWLGTHDGVVFFRAARMLATSARGVQTTAGLSRREGDAPVPFVAGQGDRPHADTVAGAAAAHATPGVRTGDDATVTRVSAHTATGHVAVEHGVASTTSERAAERPSDDVDAEALTTMLARNAITTSVHEGAVRADGRGGVGGGGAPGVGGGVGAGGRASAYTEGIGWLSLGTEDRRYLAYFREVRRRLAPLWARAFPDEDALEMRQGTVILDFVIAHDGRVHGVRVVHPSGVDAFDRNVRDAIARAELPAIPPELSAGELRVHAPFAFRNPLVR